MPFAETTRIIAVRHGETAWNVDTRLQEIGRAHV